VTGTPPKMPEKCLGSADIAQKIRHFGTGKGTDACPGLLQGHQNR
jgi:hypothetical protein